MAFKVIDNDLRRCQAWVANNYGVVGSDLVVTIGLENNGELVAVVGYNNFIDKSCHIHIYANRDAFVPKSFIWFIHHYPFVQAGIDNIIAFMPIDNNNVLNLAKHAGYMERFTLTDCGITIFTLSKDQCKWLKLRNKNGL